ncbi:MAG: ArnT family glycosyltransferase [Planctomycetaceae bacterium]
MRTESDRLRAGVIAVLMLAALARVGAAWHWRSDLSREIDGYRAIADNLRTGDGFSFDGERPTAYRPPLYPLFLAIARTGGDWSVALLQVLMGTGTVWLAYRLGRNLGLKRGAVWAAGLVAADPLLLRYTPQLMTETLFTLLVAFLLVSVTDPRDTRWRPALIGAAFGLCALCRPTIWAFGAILGGVWVVMNLDPALCRKRRLVKVGVAVAVCLLVVSPWVVRNAVVFGRPIVMTTHGGYTLLLGNNPAFYDDVVRQPWGTTWSEERLARWKQTTSRTNGETESQHDHRLFRRAVANIADDLPGFAAACSLRLRRFWNVLPLAEGTDTGRSLLAGIALFYAVQFLGLLVGLYRLRKAEWQRWWPLAALIVSFTAVHLVYWSNARMRAPLVPAIALLAMRGFLGTSRRAEE